MSVNLEDGIDFEEALLLLSQTMIVVMIGFINPWLNVSVPKDVRIRMQKSPLLGAIFVFALAFSYTRSIAHSLLIVFLYFYLKTMFIKLYSRGT